MTYKLTTLKKPNYTHFIVKGKNTVEVTLQYFQDIYDECVKNNYRTILIEEHLEGKRLETMDIYDIASKATQDYFGFFKAIAYVDVLTDKKTFSFIENLCVNRSIPLRAFATVEEADKWLTSKK